MIKQKTSIADSMRERVRKRAEANRNKGGLDTLALPEGVQLYKPEKGVIEFDIIPYRVNVDNHPEVKKGELWYERTYLVHRYVGPEEKFLICPRTVGKRCPICEEHQKLRRDPDADEDVVDGLRPKERELFNVVLKDGDGEVMVMDISAFLFGRKLEEEILEGDDSNASFAELKDGKTLKVRWEARSMGKNKFVEAGRIDFLDRDDIGEEALDVVVDLDEAMKILPYEEIEKIFQAGAGEEEGEKEAEEEQEEEKPVRRVIGGNRKPAKEKEAEDKQDDEDSSDELPGLGKKKVESDDDNICIACDGEGKTTKGKTCPICGGTGKNEDDSSNGEDEENEEGQEEEKPARRAIRR